MTKCEIISMAREAGFRTGSYTLSNGDPCVFAAPVSATDCIPELERFAALVAAAEREACAKVCEQTYPTTLDGDLPCYETPEEFAAAIRARSK